MHCSPCVRASPPLSPTPAYRCLAPALLLLVLAAERYIESCARSIAEAAESSKIVIEKSTVPSGTAQTLKAILSANSREGIDFQILSNPEFLAEGTAVKDLLKPDRVLIGGDETPEGAAAIEALAAV